MKNCHRNRYSDVPCLDSSRFIIQIRTTEDDFVSTNNDNNLSLNSSEERGVRDASPNRILMNLPPDSIDETKKVQHQETQNEPHQKSSEKTSTEQVPVITNTKLI